MPGIISQRTVLWGNPSNNNRIDYLGVHNQHNVEQAAKKVNAPILKDVYVAMRENNGNIITAISKPVGKICMAPIESEGGPQAARVNALEQMATFLNGLAKKARV